ncbi:unnamed protein product [Cuscuta europaea]|uniref:Uncharacterized protein n=1 Tax=Cuscuta europaea TaxID=41803 RepID=A0A9P1E7N2_CUSEU|nr:unnamed protein product [Cuscuta europaea]
MKCKTPTIPLVKTQARRRLVKASEVMEAADEPDIQVPYLPPVVDCSLFPNMKLTVRQNLDEFQGLMFDSLGGFPTLMSRFRGSVFGRHIDVSFIPVPSLL